LRLTRSEARELLNLPDAATLAGTRDRAIIAMLLCTGIREAELCSLEVVDLRQKLQGELALHVRFGKGRKARLVPYGALDWCLPMVAQWLRRADIHGGPVFRGLRKGDTVRKAALNERTVEKILARYPIIIDDRLRVVEPHDCRRTYARWLYDAGVKVDGIRQNLGHESIEMTFRYIGPPDLADRVPPKVFSP
jgi:integrase/recombinase XerD